MAKLKGLEIKKITEFKGHEGEPLFQCDVYYKGKKVGYFSQDAWGGMENVEVPKEVRQAFAEYTTRPLDGYPDHPLKGIEWAIYDLYELRNIEKTYAKNAKQGFDITILVDVNPWQHFSVGLKAGAMVAMSTETIVKHLKTKYKDYAHLPDKAFRIYRGTEFVVE